jgi:hypothetical protein
MKILLHHEIAESCFLTDALLYRAVGRLPLKSVPEEDETDAPPEYPNIVLTPAECRAGGLEPDPEWEEKDKDDVERQFDLQVALGDKQKAYEEFIKRKYTKEGRRSEWSLRFQELLKRYHNEFLTALRDGRLGSEGQRSGQLTEEEIAEGAGWRDIPLEAIPSSFWSSCEIDWEKCLAKGETAGYESILVKTDDLFRVFPLPASQDATGVRKIGNYLVASEQYVGPSRKGRPPIVPWDDFHLELARRVVAVTLPEKQEAGIEDMQIWCEKQWGDKPGRSTMLQKIAPYYEEFIRSRKVRK